MKLQTFMAILPLLLLSSITTVASRCPTALGRRSLSENCGPLFGGVICSGSEQWPFSSSNPFMSRPFLRSQTNLPSSVVVPSPPPPGPVFTNYPSFTPPLLDNTNPSFLPLVASPPPPLAAGYSFTTPVVPQLPPPAEDDDNDDDDDDDTSGDSPFIGVSFSPPNPEVTLPPIVERNQPHQFVSPPQENYPPSSPADVFNVSPPPLVPIGSQPPEDPGKQLPQLPPVVESPPAA